MSRRAGTPTAKKVTQLVNVEEHVEGFRQVREAHRRELIDDYVELISDLIREVGEARQVDMAARLGVSQPTVAKMLKRLATMGLIEMIPWRGVFLTAEGEKLAQESRERHQIVENFLLVLGVSPEIARRDAEAWSTMLVKRRSTLFVCLPRNTVPNEPAFFTHAARRSFFSVINSCWYRIKLFRALCTEILACCYRLAHHHHLKRPDAADQRCGVKRLF